LPGEKCLLAVVGCSRIFRKEALCDYRKQPCSPLPLEGGIRDSRGVGVGVKGPGNSKQRKRELRGGQNTISPHTHNA